MAISPNARYPEPRKNDPAWDFGNPPEGFFPPSDRAVLFNVFGGGYEAYLKLLDYERTAPVQVRVTAFTESFVTAHAGIFWPKASYVNNVCECADGKIRVVEMNPMEGSGRYEGNRADSVMLHFSSDGKYVCVSREKGI